MSEILGSFFDEAFTPEAEERLRDYLARPGYEIPAGLGTEDAACSMAAINLAISGELLDEIPACMSRVVGRWIIEIQDAMPTEMRNSEEWKELLPMAAGTGRDYEDDRSYIILEWMWDTVVPLFQSKADELGFGDEWHKMCTERTYRAISSAYWAATHVDLSDSQEAQVAAKITDLVSHRQAVRAARRVASLVRGDRAECMSLWEKIDPIRVLGRLILVV